MAFMQENEKQDNGKVMILADYPYIEMASKICEVLSRRPDMKPISEFKQEALYLNRFANGEIDTDLKKNVRNKEVFLLKSPYTIRKEIMDNMTLEDFCYDANAFVMGTAFINDALKRASAADIIDIIPHIPYQRQDRRALRENQEEHKMRKTRSPISARVVADILQKDANRFITFDPHFKQIEGFYNKPFDSLDSNILFAEYIDSLHKTKENVYIMAPDVGATENARLLARMVGTNLFGIIEKERTLPGIVSETPGLVTGPSTNGRDVYIRDDIVDGGGTLINALKILKREGAASITACISHSIFSGNAKEKIKKSGLKLVTLNTIPIQGVENYPNLTQIDITPIITEAIYSICTNRELSSLFYDYNKYKEKKLQGWGR